MDVSKQEKLNILFEQIQLPSEMKEDFLDAELRQLQIYKKSKIWHFHIDVKNVLPVTTYQVFEANLKNAFKHVASTELTIYSKELCQDPEIIGSYWTTFMNNCENLSPGYKDIVADQTPQIDNQNLILTVRNETEANLIKKRLEKEFQQYCSKVGLPQFFFKLELRSVEADVHKFKEQKALEDQEIIMKTVKEQEERTQNGKDKEQNKPISFGYPIQDDPVRMDSVVEEERRIVLQGYVFDSEVRELRSGRSLLILKVTDYTDSFQVKMFSKNDEDANLFSRVEKGIWIKARGSIQTDMYTNELAMMANDIQEIKVALKADTAEENEKRVELHAHTTMSQLDAVVSPTRLIEQASKWGHEAIAITDHAGVQGFPEAHAAGEKNGIKVIYGVEANLVDDGVPIAYNTTDVNLDSATYVVYDVETTGLSAVYDRIIELAGVKIKDGEIIDRFERFANPHHPLSQTTIQLTGITDEMVKDAPEIEDVLKDFYEWSKDCIFVAHNASFDIGFLNAGYKQIKYEKVSNP